MLESLLYEKKEKGAIFSSIIIRENGTISLCPTWSDPERSFALISNLQL